jgi:hypothetical protein
MDFDLKYWFLTHILTDARLQSRNLQGGPKSRRSKRAAAWCCWELEQAALHLPIHLTCDQPLFPSYAYTELPVKQYSLKQYSLKQERVSTPGLPHFLHTTSLTVRRLRRYPSDQIY